LPNIDESLDHSDVNLLLLLIAYQTVHRAYQLIFFMFNNDLGLQNAKADLKLWQIYIDTVSIDQFQF